MKFELDEIVIEELERESALARHVAEHAPTFARISFVSDGRVASMPDLQTSDPFAAGKRRMVVMRRRSPFLMACPAGSAQFACCGLQVLVLASNCPMDCSYCFLQEYVADNPAFQVYSNYADAFDEIDRVRASAPGRLFRIGTGELADSLAFDSITGMSRELVEYFAARENLNLELKTKTDEIETLLTLDPRDRVLVSWTLSPEAVYRTSEHRTAPPRARLAAARRVLEAGYRVAFHFDPIIAYEGADRDYQEMIEDMFDAIPPERIAFVSMGGLRMTPALRAAARRRHPNDPMLLGEEVPAADGRMRSFAPLRIGLYRTIAERIRSRGVEVPAYLCMEAASVHQRVFGEAPASVAELNQRLAIR
ncbi:MAG TPA: hypothetical protein VEF03_03995 [Candidatus Binataceae bacterium]|nr:hypothetical protein [Candidatus Binataceae bacterium]